MLIFGIPGRPCATTGSQPSANLAGQPWRCAGRPANCLVLALVVLAAGVFPSSSRADLIVNGDFETGTFTPWTVDAGPHLDAIGLQSPPYLYAGTAAKDGNDMAIFNNGSPAGGSIAQTFSTVSGTRYSVHYDYGTTGTTGSETQTVDVSVLGANGSTVLHSENQTASNNLGESSQTPQPLNTFTFTFVADGNQATLVF
jgi:hypothetical protein